MIAALILIGLASLGGLACLLRMAYLWGYVQSDIDHARRQTDELERALAQKWGDGLD